MNTLCKIPREEKSSSAIQVFQIHLTSLKQKAHRLHVAWVRASYLLKAYAVFTVE